MICKIFTLVFKVKFNQMLHKAFMVYGDYGRYFFQMKDQAPLLGGDYGRLVKYNDNFLKSSESLSKNSAEISLESGQILW